jgi:hypothetical protein
VTGALDGFRALVIGGGSGIGRPVYLTLKYAGQAIPDVRAAIAGDPPGNGRAPASGGADRDAS